MINYISSLAFVVLVLVGAALALLVALVSPTAAIAVAAVWLAGDVVAASSIKLAAQWEQALVFRLGKYHSIRGPGLFLVIPLVDQVRMVDIRIRATDIPAQQVITKDNVPVTINGVFFFKVDNVADAIIKVQDYRTAIGQYAQTSLRDVIGQMTLDQLLVEREAIGKAIATNVEKDIEGWGLEVTGIRIQDINMPEELKKMMSCKPRPNARSARRSRRPKAIVKRRTIWPRRPKPWRPAPERCNCGLCKPLTAWAQPPRTRWFLPSRSTSWTLCMLSLASATGPMADWLRRMGSRPESVL